MYKSGCASVPLKPAYGLQSDSNEIHRNCYYAISNSIIICRINESNNKYVHVAHLCADENSYSGDGGGAEPLHVVTKPPFVKLR